MIPPQGVGGIRKLSELLIDTNKDWGKYNIINFGSGGVDLYSMLTAHASRHAYGGADAIPSGGIARSQLEYPTVDVDILYLLHIGKAIYDMHWSREYQWIFRTTDFFTDKAIETITTGSDSEQTYVRRSGPTTFYCQSLVTASTTADFAIRRCVNASCFTIATEAVDLTSGYKYLVKLQASGSTIKAFRTDMTTAKLSVTDTNIASGTCCVNFGESSSAGILDTIQTGFLRAPLSPSPPASAIIEADISSEVPYHPLLNRNLAEISSLTGLPDFLYAEAKKYSILKSKGFADEEIQLLFGYIPQHQVDLDSVTWGAFELHADKAPTVIVTITGDNPYKSGAIQRQIDFARSKNLRVFSPPRDYREAVALYNQLERDYPHWLAGKDNFAYQTLGWEILDWFQNVDFYYGELLDHKTHYNQLKQVPDWEITNRLNELINKLSRETVLTDERDKHISKAKEILKKGW